MMMGDMAFGVWVNELSVALTCYLYFIRNCLCFV